MAQTLNTGEELPLELPLREALKIYGKRLALFFLVIAINLGLLGLIFLVVRFR